MMYRCDISWVKNGIKVIPHKEGKRITWREALYLFQHDESFVDEITRQIGFIDYSGVFWETPRVDLDENFEFVVIDAPELSRTRADSTPFEDHMTGNGNVASFPNIRGDAYLVVPLPRGNKDLYAHLTPFVRGAPREQILELFKVIGREASLRAESQNLWISTSGLGVSWLHVRLDSSPKYYSYRPYKEL